MVLPSRDYLGVTGDLVVLPRAGGGDANHSQPVNLWYVTTKELFERLYHSSTGTHTETTSQVPQITSLLFKM